MNGIPLNDGEKRCSKCGKSKPLSDFAKDKQTDDGLRRRCRICHNAYRRGYTAKNREKESLYHKKYYKNNREKLIQHATEYQQNNKDVINARRRKTYKRKKLAQQRNGT